MTPLLAVAVAVAVTAPEPPNPVPVLPVRPAVERAVGGAAFDRGVFVERTRDGGSVVVGVTASSGHGGEDVYLVRFDEAGDVLWSKTFGGADEDNGWCVREVDDGFVFAGFTKSFGSGGYDFYLVKTDERGERIWSRTFGGADDDRCWMFDVTDDGGFILVGETRSAGAGERDFFAVRTDASGKEVWSNTYGGAKDDRCFAVVSADDGYVLAGQTFSEGAGDRDAWVVKIDNDGERQWAKTFGGAESDVAHGVCATTDGAFMVTGYTTSLAHDGDDPYLIKIDGEGKVEWTSVVPIAGIAHTITGEQAADGGYYCVGFVAAPGRGPRRGLLVKTDGKGRARWQWHPPTGAHEETMGYTVRATPSGGCIFTGHRKIGENMDLLLIEIENAQPGHRAKPE